MKSNYLISTALTLGVAGLLLPVEEARADDCLLDRDNDGNVDVGPTDNDGGANSSGVDTNLACGVGADATGGNATAIGANAVATGPDTTAIGANTLAYNLDSVAVGQGARASSSDTTAIGDSANASFGGATAVGSAANASQINSSAFGGGAQAVGNSSTAIGHSSTASLLAGVAVGTGANAAGNGDIAIGGLATTLNQGPNQPGGNIAIGTAGDTVNGSLSGVPTIAIGGDSIAIGRSAIVIAPNSVAIGAQSTTSQEGVVSVGNVNLKRRIINVADGTALTDAVTLGQLNAATQSSRYTVVNSTAGVPTVTGTNAIGIGVFALSSGDSSVAIGNGALALPDFSTAVGTAALATGVSATAVGRSAGAGGENAVAIGNSASAALDNSVALGFSSAVTEENTVSVGRVFDDSGTPDDPSDDVAAITRRIVNVADGTAPNDAVTVGQLSNATADLPYLSVNSTSGSATTSGTDAIALGRGANASGNGSLALGGDGSDNDATGAVASNISASAVGPDSLASGGDASAFGASSVASKSNATAIGSNALASGTSSTAIGFVSGATADNTVALGAFANATGTRALAIGFGAVAGVAADTTAVGGGATASAVGSVALGADSRATVANTVSIGRAFDDNGTPSDPSDDVAAITRRITNVADGVAASDAATVGQIADVAFFDVGTASGAASAAEPNAIAIGADGADMNSIGAQARAQNTIAIGTDSDASEQNAIAIGLASNATGDNNIAFGRQAMTQNTGTIAIGNLANASGARSVALGENSVADAADTVSVGRAFSDNGTPFDPSDDTVAITRRITNVTDGTDLSDAVTLGQLNAAIAGVAPGSVYLSVNSNSGSSTAAGTDAIALGRNASASGLGSLAIGSDSSIDLGSDGAIASNTGATAVGTNALASGNISSAFGATSAAANSGATAIGSVSRAAGDRSTAVGSVAVAIGDRSTVVGAGASTIGERSVAIGQLSGATGVRSTALGQASNAFAGSATALGAGSTANAVDSVALGADSIANVANTVSVGRAASDNGTPSDPSDDIAAITRKIVNVADGSANSDAATVGQLNTAIANVSIGGNAFLAVNSTGLAASASGSEAVALGTATNAQGTSSIAIGGDAIDADNDGAQATGDFSLAIGPDASASGPLAYALGALSSAGGVNATALGTRANAAGNSSLALGSGSSTSANFSSAIGSGATASHTASFAIGVGAVTTRVNQIVLGQTGSGFGATGPVTVTIPGLPTAASNTAQSGQLFYVTVDASGNLGFSDVPIGGVPVPLPSSQSAAGPNVQTAQSTPTTQVAASSVSYDPSSSAPVISATSVDGGPAGVPGAGVATADASRMIDNAVIAAPHAEAENGSAGLEGRPSGRTQSGEALAGRSDPLGTEVAELSAQAGDEAQVGTRATMEAPVEVAMLDETQDIAAPPADADVDAGTRNVATSAYSPSVELSPAAVPTVAQVTQTQFDQLSNRVGAVEGRLDLVEGQLAIMNEEIASSTAVAVAMGGTTFLPDQNFSLSANIGTYDGAHAGSFNIGALVSENVAVNAGVATGFNKRGKTAGRVGVTIGF